MVVYWYPGHRPNCFTLIITFESNIELLGTCTCISESFGPVSYEIPKKRTCKILNISVKNGRYQLCTQYLLPLVVIWTIEIHSAIT